MPTTRDNLEIVNLMELLDPNGSAERKYIRLNPKADWKSLSWTSRYDIALSHFRASHASSGVKEQRNTVQNRLMIASERRCNRFTQYLRNDASHSNFSFGAVSGVLSTFGALVGGPALDAKRLSGLSALTGGLRAEYNNEFYSSLATHVIVRGIEEKRRELRDQIAQRQKGDYASYDIGTAILDAVQYDGSCDIVNGLKTADEALARLREPGRTAINNALIQNELTRAIAQGTPEDVQAWRDKVAALSLDANATARIYTGGGAGGTMGATGDLNPLTPLLDVARFKAAAAAATKEWTPAAIAALREAAGSSDTALIVTVSKSVTSSITVSVIVTEPGTSVTKTVSQPAVTTTLSVSTYTMVDTAKKEISALIGDLAAAVESVNDKACGKDADEIHEAARAALAASVKAGTDTTKRRVATDALEAAQERVLRFSLRIQRHIDVLQTLQSRHVAALSEAAATAKGEKLDLPAIWKAGETWLKLGTAKEQIGDTLLCR